MLPSIIDPNQSQVHLKVYLNDDVFKFDNNSLSIAQIKKSETPVNETIKIKLTNGKNLSATYSMTVEFYCPDTAAAIVQNFTKQTIR